ncbi:hypothetical protein B0J14DRAFT_576537 [Halenospora varia]|nr:hypothetical protein B0J14DRAFT_576537 [Halenospora varia]
MASNSTAPTINYWESPEYKGNAVRNLNSTLIGVTTVVIFLRLYTRGFMSKSLGLDDALAFVAYVLVTCQSAFDIQSVGFGSGAHIRYVPPQLIPHFFSNLVTNTLLYFIGTGLMRLSICAFLPRLAKDLSSPFFLRSVYAVAALAICQTIICFFYRLTECPHIPDIWKVPSPDLNCKTSNQEQANMKAHAGITIIIDFALFALPIWVINAKMMKSSKKYQVMLVFSVGLFVVATGIVRMVYVCTLDFLADPTFEMSTIGFWTDLEGHAGLWVASFPSLQPMLRLVSYKLGLRSVLSSYNRSKNGKSKNKSGNNNLGGSSSDWGKSATGKKGYIRNGSGVDADDNSTRNIVGSDKSGTELDNLSTDSDGHGRIHKQVEYDVRVEEMETGKQRGSNVQNKSWVDV